jgi:RNA polymerase sigma factor (sigma-70 family)
MILSSYNEAQLWDSFRAGEEKALDTIYNMYAETLFSYGIHIYNNLQLVEDCVHDLFIKIYQRKENLGPTTSIKFYLMRCIRTQIFDTLAKSKKIHTDDITENKKYDFLFEAKEEVDMVNKQNNDLLTITMLAEINNLPKKQREIIYLIFYKDMTYDEVAVLLDITIRTVYNQVYNAIQRLKKANKIFEKFLAA